MRDFRRAIGHGLVVIDLRDDDEHGAFRASVRSWLADHLTDGLRGHRGGEARFEGGLLRDWSRALHRAGYAGLTWPTEYGGGGRPVEYQAILLEELARAEAPPHIGVIGLGMVGPTLIAHGTEEQKARYLARILSADDIWCQGFSEPGAGSDLAAIRLAATPRGNVLVLEGQKVWSSYAHIADYCLLLCRTDPASAGREGLSCLIVPMGSPGVEVRPIRQLTGESEFNEVFFREVEVPVANLVGEAGSGWTIAMTTLSHERGTLGLALTAQLEVVLGKLVALARARGVLPRQRDAIAREWARLQALRLTAWRLLGAADGASPGPETSMVKLEWSEANQRVGHLALEIMGEPATDVAPRGSAAEFWQYFQLQSRGNTIGAGTSEILRNALAERVLGLPRSR